MNLTTDCGSEVTLVEHSVLRALICDEARLDGAVLVSIQDQDQLSLRYTVEAFDGAIGPRCNQILQYLDSLLLGFWTQVNGAPTGETFTFLVQGSDTPADAHSVAFEAKRHYRQICLVPDLYYFSNAGYAALFPHATPDWDRRQPKAFWRGATTGMMFDAAGAFLALSRESLDQLPRYRLCQIGRGLEDRTDFGIYIVCQAAGREEHAAIEALLVQQGILRARVPIEHYANFKFIVQIDGNANAWGVLEKLRLGGCLLLVESDWVNHFQRKLLAWEHYVPVQNDLSDLAEKIDWCLANEASARDIAEHGRALALSITYDDEMRRAMRAIHRHIRNP